jgi:hypothetical protein
MSGNTDFWRNDRSTQTGQPTPGNKTFGADRPWSVYIGLTQPIDAILQSFGNP